MEYEWIHTKKEGLGVVEGVGGFRPWKRKKKIPVSSITGERRACFVESNTVFFALR